MKESETELYNLTENNLEITLIKKFLIFSSGANLSIIKYCSKEAGPKEANKFASIGATILLTAILASLSGGYAFNFVFDNFYFSTIFGILWGVVIFNLDRYIVMSLRKSNSEKLSDIIQEADNVKRRAMMYDKISSSLNTLFIALPRIIIAIIIALTVSKPIELRLFNNTIEKELGNIASTDITEFETKFKNEISGLNLKIDELNQKEILEKEKVYQNNPVYQNKLNAVEKIDNDITNIGKNIKNNEGIIEKNKYLKTGYRNVINYDADGNPRRVEESYKYWANNRTAQAKTEENNSLEKRKGELFSERKQIKGELLEIENEFQENVVRITENYNASRQPIQEQIKNKNSTYSEDLIEWKLRVRASTDLLSRLTALGNITGEISKEGSRNSAYWASFLITMLFISLETAPVIVKLLTKRGPYDELLDRIEYEYFINQQEAISKLNSEVNSILEKIQEVSKLKGETFLQVEQQKLDAELKNNESLLNDIAEKQAYLAKLSIDKWYEEELEKLKSKDPD